MNEKQRAMLEGLYKKDEGWEESFRFHYEKFVGREIESLGLLPLDPVLPEKYWPRADQIMEYFVRIARARDLTKSILTIEQMLHLSIVDLQIVEYNSWPRNVFDMSMDRMASVRAEAFVSMPDYWEALGEYGNTLVADPDQSSRPTC